ncbi:MAG: AAA family ATPase [Planctomycetes bacterium]|nr:AAA family ATPase [Planctomycetota bacterium]
MYANHFGLRCLPFEDRADVQFFFPTAASEEAVAAMEYETHYGKGMALVLGEAGTGKTLLIRTLLQRLHATDHSVIVTWPASGGMDLVRECCKGFGVSLSSTQSQGRHLDRLSRHLTRTAGAGHRSILILDQAENLSAANLDELATLNDLESEGNKLLSVILVGQPRLRTMIEQPALSRLRQQTFGERTLTPLSCADVGEYIKHRLGIAGAGETSLFDVDAVELIHSLAGGIPRMVNNICNAAMLSAYAAGAMRIDRTIVEDTSDLTPPTRRALPAADLGITSPASLPVAGDAFQAPFPTARVQRGVATHAEFTGQAKTVTPSSQPLRVEQYTDEGFVDEAAICDRLERALARAERMSTTSEARFTQITAAEDHLTTLLEHAERMTATLQASSEEAPASVDRAHRRIEGILVEAERRIAAIETCLGKTSTITADTEMQIQRAHDACQRAEEAEARLTSFAEQIADKADEVQERVTLLMRNVEAAEGTKPQLEELIAQASSMTPQIEHRIQAIRSDLKHTLDGQGRSARETFDAMQSKLDNLIAQVRSTTADADAKISALTGKLKAAVAEGEQFEKSFSETVLRRLSDGATEQADALLRSQQQQFDAALAQHGTKLDAMTDAADRRLEQLRSNLDGLDARCPNVESSIENLSFAIEKSENRVARLTADTKIVDTTIEELAARAAALDGPLTEKTAHAQKVAEQLKSASEEVKVQQQQVATALVDIGMGCERVAGARKVAGECEQIAERFTRDGADGRELAEKLTALVASAQPLTQAITRVIDNAQNTIDQLDTQQVTASDVIERLIDGNATGCKLIDHTTASALAAEQAARDARDQADRLAGVDETLTRLDGVVGSARQLHEALQGLVSHADEKVGRLDSHNAAANQVLEQLAGANVTAQTAIETIDTSCDAADKAFKSVCEDTGRMIEEIWSLTGKTEASMKKLADANASAGAMLRKIEESSKPNGRFLAELSDKTAKAEEALTKLTQGQDKAGKLADRLKTIASVLATAKEVDGSVKETLDQARKLFDEMQTMTDQAGEQCATLQEYHASTQGLIQTHQQIAAESEEGVQRFMERMHTVQAGEQLVDDLLDQTESIRADVDKLHAQVAEPKAVIAEAREQSAQLARVCAAVRKVFAGLASASLEAKRDTEAFRGTSSEAAQRLTQLTSETERAARTLQQWVEEAVQVQSRLQRTLRDCPSIEQTHPTSTLRGVERAIASVPRIQRTGVDAELTMLTDREESAAPSAESFVTDKPQTRAEEISRLITEAKQADATVEA